MHVHGLGRANGQSSSHVAINAVSCALLPDCAMLMIVCMSAMQIAQSEQWLQLLSCMTACWVFGVHTLR